MYKSLAQPRALACMLRLRCSPELELRGAHGGLAADRWAGRAHVVSTSSVSARQWPCPPSSPPPVLPHHLEW